MFGHANCLISHPGILKCDLSDSGILQRNYSNLHTFLFLHKYILNSEDLKVLHKLKPARLKITFHDALQEFRIYYLEQSGPF